MKTPPNYPMPTTAPELPTIAAAAFATKSLTTCSHFLARAGLEQLLAGAEHFTLFAPTEEAFRNLDPDTLEAFNADPKRLRAMLEYHIVVGGREREAFSNSRVKTLEGSLLTAAVTDDGLMVDHASTTGRQVICSNGVIHPIDAVLMPGFKPTLSAKAREVSAWTGQRDRARPATPPENWPFLEPQATPNKSAG